MKVGVALGGGGVRGLAHAMALETIDACGITPTMVAGTSMGAIIGALYASGRSGCEIRELIERHIVTRKDGLAEIYQKKKNLIKWFKIFRPTSSSSGMMKVDGLMSYLLEDLKMDTFEELRIPLYAVATDYYRREPVVFNSGELLPAIQASMSIPGVFVPVVHNGRVLVDGGLTNQVPYDLLADSCDVTIAVDVGPTWNPDETKPPSAMDAVLGVFDLVVDNGVAARLKERRPTIYVRPTLKGIRVLDFDKIEDTFEQARPAMEELRTKLEALRAK